MRFFPFFLLIVVLTQPALAEHPFDQPFTLGVGESLLLGDREVTVGFEGINNDSRCPIGVWCFWEGDAEADLWLQVTGQERQDFVLHTYSGFTTFIEMGTYTICLQEVTPYPVANIPIDPETYEVILLVYLAAVSSEPRPWGEVRSLYR